MLNIRDYFLSVCVCLSVCLFMCLSFTFCCWILTLQLASFNNVESEALPAQPEISCSKLTIEILE